MPPQEFEAHQYTQNFPANANVKFLVNVLFSLPVQSCYFVLKYMMSGSSGLLSKRLVQTCLSFTVPPKKFASSTVPGSKIYFV
jgi:hypothetical protein